MSTDFKFKPRKYLHFDGTISKDAAETLATDPVKVSKHSFYPLLGFIIETPKMEKVDGVIKKIEAKERPIKIAAHADAAIYCYYAQKLKEPYEQMLVDAGISECITAFRTFSESGRNNIWFANEVFDFIQKNRSCTALALDVTKFFDRMNHQVLKKAWQKVLNVSRLPDDHFSLFKNLTNFTWVERDEAYIEMGISLHNPRPKDLRRTKICNADEFRSRIREKGLIKFNPEQSKKRGIPQGSPISALLSNIYMFEFDKAMHKAVEKCNGLYRRYCDDIMLIVPPEHAEAIEKYAMGFIERLKLNINENKTNRVEFPKGVASRALNNNELQYLGFVFNGTRILIRNGSLSRYYSKMRRAVRYQKQKQRKENRIADRKGTSAVPLRRRSLYIKYSYLAKRRVFSQKGKSSQVKGNFITYAYRASKTMQSPEIKQQVKNHWSKLQFEIEKY